MGCLRKSGEDENCCGGFLEERVMETSQMGSSGEGHGWWLLAAAGTPGYQAWQGAYHVHGSCWRTCRAWSGHGQWVVNYWYWAP
ncbi:hypothetical protein V6N13_097808 [Hibiscus sabdariffa]